MMKMMRTLFLIVPKMRIIDVIKAKAILTKKQQFSFHPTLLTPHMTKSSFPARNLTRMSIFNLISHRKHEFNFYVSLQQVSREEGEDTDTTPTLQRESPDFVSLEEDTTVGERREGRLERENFRLKEQVAVKLFLVLIFLGNMRIWREKITSIWKVSICWRSLLDENRNLIRKQPG